MKHLIYSILCIVLLTPSCKTVKPFENLKKSCASTIALYNNDINSNVKSIRFTAGPGTIITYSEVGTGWTQLSNFPNSVIWFAPATGFPVGNPIIGNFKIWIRIGSGNIVNVEYLDNNGSIVCKKEVTLNCNEEVIKIICSEESSDNCCFFALRCFNNLANTFKQIEVTPINPSDILAVNLGIDDDLDWTLTQSGNNYIFSYINTSGNGFIPADPIYCIDAAFTILANPNSISPKIMLKWLDANSVVQKTEEISLICMNSNLLEDEDFEYDWTLNTKNQGGTIHDSILFAGAEALPCSYLSQLQERDVTCPTISSTFFCVGNQLTVTLSCTAVSSDVPSPTYFWSVDNIAMTASGTSISTPLNGIGQTTATVALDVHGISPDTNTDSIYCSQTISIPYCKATAHFIATKPIVQCNPPGTLLGWDVSFIHISPCTNIASYKWEYGDGNTSGLLTGAIVDPTYRYTLAGTYSAKLTITDQLGCSHSYTQSIVIPKECSPDFHINYEWCEEGQQENQKYQVKVEFTNLSVSFCSSSYLWNYGDGSAPDANGVHVYNTFPNQQYTVTLTMKDTKMCPNGKSTSYTFNLKPVSNRMKVVTCSDGMVIFENPCNVHWKLPNWQLITQDPSYYCLPSPFDPWLNIQINAFLGILGTSVPQLWVNTWNNHNFQLRMKDGANFTIESTCKEDQGTHTTGICTKVERHNVHITCCITDFKSWDYRYKSIGTKNYRTRIRFNLKYIDGQSAPGPGACLGYYLSLSSIVSDKTKVLTRTSLQRERQVLGMKYWTWSIADYIDTGITNSLPTSPSSNFLTFGSSGCNCTDPITWVGNKHKPNRIMLSFRGNTPSLYRIDKNNILNSFHYIEKNSTPWMEYIVKPAGNCKPPS